MEPLQQENLGRTFQPRDNAAIVIRRFPGYPQVLTTAQYPEAAQIVTMARPLQENLVATLSLAFNAMNVTLLQVGYQPPTTVIVPAVTREITD